jgi:hypothetical protein
LSNTPIAPDVAFDEPSPIVKPALKQLVAMLYWHVIKAFTMLNPVAFVLITMLFEIIVVAVELTPAVKLLTVTPPPDDAPTPDITLYWNVIGAAFNAFIQNMYAEVNKL